MRQSHHHNSLASLHSLNRRQSQLPSGTHLRVRVRALVLERLDELVQQHGEEGAADGSDPVDPLRFVEGVDCDGGAEGAGGV